MPDALLSSEEAVTCGGFKLHPTGQKNVGGPRILDQAGIDVQRHRLPRQLKFVIKKAFAFILDQR